MEGYIIPRKNLVDRSIRAINDALAEYLSGVESIKNDTIFSAEHNAERLFNHREKSGKILLDKISEFRNEYKLTRDYWQRKANREKSAYTPQDKNDEMLYYFRKQEFLKHLQEMNPEEILTSYDKTDDPVVKRIYEEEGPRLLKSKRSPKERTFVDIVKKVQNDRLTEETRKEIESLSEIDKLFNCSERLLTNLRKGDGKYWLKIDNW